ncbi:MAG: tRNA 2-thiocytidine biosynthesis protein TtcA [Firmicutes bacterium]|nr:tRNA 2-thiocytidine biosynthesis protein TtcA [Bacillota bacterium]
MKEILGCIKLAQEEFHMFDEGDVVAVGLSGGKDSMTLLHALNLYRRFAPVNFTLKAVTVDMGFEGFDRETLTAFCREWETDFILEKTRLGEMIFEERQEKNPCSLCSRMRRGILHRVCEENGVTKLALGHHGDDLLETFFMSMLYESRVNAFKAVTAFERTDLIQIRPLIYAEESQVREAAFRHSIPTVTNPCPASGETRRQEVKEALEAFLQRTGRPRSNMIRALCRSEIVL